MTTSSGIDAADRKMNMKLGKPFTAPWVKSRHELETVNQQEQQQKIHERLKCC